LKSYQKTLLDILRASINNEKFDCRYNITQWEELIHEAKEHNISSLIYYTLSKDTLQGIDSTLLKKWKKEVIMSNIIQINHIKQMYNVILELKKENIEIIILKGLVLRKLYPRPELRTMGDADILVKVDDYKNVKECLRKLGYVSSNHNNTIHEGFICSGNLEIEVHNKLINNDFIYVDNNKFEGELWSKKTIIEFNGVLTNTLSKEDFLIHLCFHMAVHTKAIGYGIRQLYDLTLFLINNINEIKWIEFEEKLSQYGLLKYVQGLIMLIDKIFYMNISDRFTKNNNIQDKEINLLLENIMMSGVHGKKHLNEDFQILYKSSNKHKDDQALIRRFLRFLFPHKGTLIYEYGEKYSYINNNIILIPVAWTDRIFNGILKKYGLINTINQIKYCLIIIRMRRNIIKSFSIPN